VNAGPDGGSSRDPLSAWEPEGPKPEQGCENVEVAVNVKDVGGMLLGTRADDEIRDADPLLAVGRELTLRALGCGDRLPIDAEVAEERQRGLLLDIVGWGCRAVEDL